MGPTTDLQPSSKGETPSSPCPKSNSPSPPPPQFPDAVRAYDDFTTILDDIRQTSTAHDAVRGRCVLDLLDAASSDDSDPDIDDITAHLDNKEQHHLIKHLPGLLGHAQKCYAELDKQRNALPQYAPTETADSPKRRKTYSEMAHKIDELMQTGRRVVYAAQALEGLAEVKLERKKTNKINATPARSHLSEAWQACLKFREAVMTAERVHDEIFEDGRMIFKGQVDTGKGAKEAERTATTFRNVQMLEQMAGPLRHAQERDTTLRLLWAVVGKYMRSGGEVDSEHGEMVEKNKRDGEERLEAMECGVWKAAKCLVKEGKNIWDKADPFCLYGFGLEALAVRNCISTRY